MLKHTDKKLKQKGFTVIEVLVASTIIAVLATIGFVSYSSINRRARNTKRQHDLEQIRNAQEMYKSDSSVSLSKYTLDYNDLKNNGYLQDIPKDPKTDQPYFISDNSGGALTKYCVCSIYEPASSAPPSSGGCFISGYDYCQSNP